MITAEKGKVTLGVIQVKQATNVAVTISVPCKGLNAGLGMLNGSAQCRCAAHKDLSDAAVYYSMALMVRNALCGDPTAVKNSKVDKVECSAHNNVFVMSWTMKGVLSHVRKSLAIALRSMQPARLSATYMNVMRAAGAKPKKEHFVAAAQQVVANINQGVQCMIVGGIKTDKDKIKAAVDVLHSKLAVKPVTGDRSAYTTDVACECSHVELKTTGWKAFVVHDYISSRMPGVNVWLGNSSIMVSILEKNWPSASDKLKAAVKTTVQARYARLKDDLGGILAYQAAATASLGYSDTVALSKVSPADVQQAITAVF